MVVVGLRALVCQLQDVTGTGHDQGTEHVLLRAVTRIISMVALAALIAITIPGGFAAHLHSGTAMSNHTPTVSDAFATNVVCGLQSKLTSSNHLRAKNTSKTKASSILLDTSHPTVPPSAQSEDNSQATAVIQRATFRRRESQAIAAMNLSVAEVP